MVLTNSSYTDDVNNRIFNSIADVFQQAQSSYAGHRKHVAVLKKIQSKAVLQGYEDAFTYWFNKSVTRVLPLKKNEVVGDRIVKLIAAFIASLDRENELLRTEREHCQGDNTETDLSEKEKVTTRFIDAFIRHILRGVESKDKNVRFRVMQLLAVVMDNLGEIEEDLYNLLMWSLNKRCFDKESTVRTQAVFCLTKFQDDPSEINDHDTDESQDNEATVKLKSIIQNDPSAEVRRAAMLNIINIADTRSYIMERARDVNPINRRLIYSRVLKTMGKKCFTDLDPRMLDQLILWGLEDREENVRKACEKLITHQWVNLLEGDLIQLLENLDVAKSKSCVKVIGTLLNARNDIISKIKFPENLWKDFTVEIAFLFRCFYLHCLENNIIEVIDETFPEAAKLSNILSFYIDERFKNDSQATLSKLDRRNLEFIIEQLLLVAEKYDFSDEIGRREMLNVIRNMLGLKNLSDSLIKVGLQVLKSLSINERDFVTMAIEIINDLRDDDIEEQEEAEKNGKEENGENEDEEDEDLDSFHSVVENLVDGSNKSIEDQLSSIHSEREASAETIAICLTRSSHMLELVNTSLEQNILISSLIDTLITPAVRNTEPKIRELGIKNLGLCCLLDVKLATESMYILGMCVSKGNASLKRIALQVIVDIFSVHGNAVVDGTDKVDSISLHKIFYKVLKNDNIPECQVTAAEGLCKLFLADVFTDDDLFETLVLSYFSPANSANEPLIQAFAFCIPVYCFSHPLHQQRMSRIAADVLMRLCILWDDLQSSSDPNIQKNAMLKPNIITQQLIHWTDPRKLVHQSHNESLLDTNQIDFLIDILKVFTQLEKKDIRKMILTNINNFYISPDQDYDKFKLVMDYIDDIIENTTLDSVSLNSLRRFKDAVTKIMDEMDEKRSTKDQEESDSSNQDYSVILEDSHFSENLSDINDDIRDNESTNEMSENSEMVLGKETTKKEIKKRNRMQMEIDDDFINENTKQDISNTDSLLQQDDDIEMND